jgi:hypothetical protein
MGRKELRRRDNTEKSGPGKKYPHQKRKRQWSK